MADLYYYEAGYIDDGYHVYIADAEIYISPYFEDGYIDAGYYLDYSAIGTLTCDADVVTGVTVEASGTWTSAATLSAVIGRLQSAQADFTGAFTPTLTVDAFKNHTAIIESTTTFTVDAQANRSANVLLEHIANLNAQAAKTAVIDSTMAITATVSAQVLKLKITSGSFASSSSFYAGRLTRAGRPRPYTQVGTPSLDTSNKKFGAASLSANYTNYVTVPASQDWTKIRTIDFWFRIPQPGGSGAFAHTVLEWYTDANNYRAITFSSQTAGIKFGITGAFYTNVIAGVSYYGNLDFGNGISFNTWRHFRLLDDGSTYTIWIDGTKQNLSALNYSSAGLGLNQTLKIGSRVVGSDDISIDELLITRETLTAAGTNSFTPASDRYYPEDQSKILLLSHFDSDYTDDVGEWMTPVLALSMSASLSAQANGNTKSVSADITSSTTLSATVGKSQSAGAGLSATTTQSTNAVKTVQATATISSSASVNATAFRIQEFISNQNALFTPSIAVQAQLAGVALLETQFTQTASAVKTTDVTATITSTATVTAASTVTAGLASDLASTATVTVTGTRTQPATVDLASESTLACDFTAFNNVSAAFTSQVTLTADVERYRLTASTLSTTVTLSAAVERFRSTSSTISATATVTATVTRIQSADSALSSVVTQSTVAVKTPGVGVSITGTTTITATPIYTAAATATVGALFTPSITVQAQLAGVALLESTSSLAAVIGSIKQSTNLGSALGLAVTSSEPYIGNLSGLPFFGLKVREPQFTASIWARRLSVTGTPQPLWSSYDATFGGQTAGALILNGNDVILRFNYDPDEPNAEWTDLAPTDSDWHHYLIRSTGNASFPVNNWQLWIDGVYQGVSSSYFAAGQIEFSNGGRALIGNGQIANLTPGYDLTSRRLNGDVLQLWMGLTTDAEFNPVLFYDGGYQDFGVTGTLGGLLPTPKIYHRLETPFTGITSAEGSGSLALGYDRTVARFTNTATANAISLFVANCSAQANLTTAITYQVNPQIAAASVSTITCQITQFTGIIANVASTVTLSCDETKINGGNAALTSLANIQAVAGFFENFSASLASTVTLDCDFDNIPPTRGEANLLAQFTVTANVASFTDAIILAASLGTVSCDATVIPPIRATADLTTTSTLTVTIGSIEQFAALVMSAGTMTITAQKTTGIIQTVSAVSTVSCEIKHYKGIILNLSAFNTQVSVGTVINIDPYLTLIIDPESRAVFILPENREITIESETRVNII